jgi:hypothetical protein
LFNDYIYDGAKLFIYNGDIDYLIEKTLLYLNLCDENQIIKFKKLSISCLEKAYFYFGNGAFRKELYPSNPINMNIFETTMYLMTLVEGHNNIIKEKIKDKLYKTITGKDYLDYIGDGRDSYSKVKGRFSLMEEIVREI